MAIGDVEHHIAPKMIRICGSDNKCVQDVSRSLGWRDRKSLNVAKNCGYKIP